MLTSGFFKIHRGILKYFKRPYSENEAWIWMISQAEYRNGDKRSRVSGTMRQLSEAWGVSRMQASRWLTKWGSGENPRISCQYARFGGNTCYVTEVVTEGVTGRVTAATEITLLNYDKYQGLDKPEVTGRVTGGVTASGTLLKKEEKKRKKRSTPLPPKNVEDIKAELEKVDLPKLRKKFSTKDVNGRWEEFYEACVEGTAKKPGPNPYDYVDFEKGFCTWLRKSPDILSLSTPPAHRKWDPKNERM